MTARRRGPAQGALEVSARMARRLLPLGTALGVDALALYRRHRVDVTRLEDPSGRLPLALVLDVLEELHAAARCPNLGLELARHATPDAYHAPGLLLLASNDLREGLARSFAFQRVWGDGERFALVEPGELGVEESGLGITFAIPTSRRLGHEVLEVCALAETLNAARMLAGCPDAVPLAYGLPSTSDDVPGLCAHFGQLPRLGVPRAFLVLSDAWASAPLPNANAMFFSIFEQQADAELARLPAALDLRARLRAEILRGLTRGQCQLPDCARALGLSERAPSNAASPSWVRHSAMKWTRSAASTRAGCCGRAPASRRRLCCSGTRSARHFIARAFGGLARHRRRCAPARAEAARPAADPITRRSIERSAAWPRTESALGTRHARRRAILLERCYSTVTRRPLRRRPRPPEAGRSARSPAPRGGWRWPR